MKNERKINNYLNLEIEDILLEFANLYNQVTTSDLQGIAMVKAEEIIELVKAKNSKRYNYLR